jgi:hypothetical protein
MMTDEEYRALLEKRILRHLAMKAGKNPGHFVCPSMAGLREAAWREDDERILEAIDRLLDSGQIRAVERVGTDGQLITGYICLPAKHRTVDRRPISSELRLTPEDEDFLRSCGIGVEEPEVVGVR